MVNKFILLLLLGSALSVHGEITKEIVIENISVADVTPVRNDSAALSGRKWTYADCVNYAVANNPDIRNTILTLLEKEVDVQSAKDAWLPTVDFSTNHSFSNYPSPVAGQKSNGYNSNYGVNGSWTLWEGNARRYRLESARILRRQQELTGADQIKELKLSILQAYLNILYSREAVEIARQTLEVSQAQAQRTAKLVEAGRSSRVDLAQIESQRAQDEYNLVQANNQVASDVMTLKKLLAMRLDATLDIADSSFPDSEVYVTLPAETETFSNAITWLPEFKNNELSQQVYANDIKIAKADRLPDISLNAGIGTGYSSGGPGWGYQMGHGFNEFIGAALNVPIFDANKTKRSVAKAKLAALEYDINRDRLLDNLSQTIENLYIQARNAKAKYESGKSRLESMQLTSELVDRQFDLGLVNPLELLTAHNNLLTARLEQLQNKYMAILANKTIEFYNTQEVSLP